MPPLPAHVTSLPATVAAAVASGRIGRPVFVRWIQRVDSRPDSALDDALDVVSGWFGGEPGFDHRTGDTVAHASLLARWPGGQSALVIACSPDPGGGPALDIALIGERGAVYHRA